MTVYLLLQNLAIGLNELNAGIWLKMILKF